MKNIDKIKEILKQYFKKHPEIEVAYIFGSVAQGKENPLSDIDIAIIINPQQINEKMYRYGYKAEVLSDLIKLLKTNNVDLVILNEADIVLRHRVSYFSKLIYSKNEKNELNSRLILLTNTMILNNLLNCVQQQDTRDER